MQILTYKDRLKDRRAATALRGHAFQCNQIWNWCVAQHRDTLNRYRAGAPKRKWLSHFDLAKTFKGYGKEIGLHQHIDLGRYFGRRPFLPRDRRHYRRSRFAASALS